MRISLLNHRRVRQPKAHGAHVARFWMVAIFVMVVAQGCGQSASFGSGPSPKTPASAANDPKANVAAMLALGNRYTLSIANGAAVLAPAITTALPGIIDIDTNAPLDGTQIGKWEVTVYLKDTPVGKFGPVAATQLDLSKSSGMVTVQADFREKGGTRKGTAYASLFVDAEKPHANLVRLDTRSDPAASNLHWTAVDNYRVNQERSALIACKHKVDVFAPKSFAELSSLPKGCVLVDQGASLFAKPANLTLGAPTIDGATVPSSETTYGLYVEDMVGASDFGWETDPNQATSQLILATKAEGVTYTASKDVSAQLALSAVNLGKTTVIDDSVNSALWPNYKITVSKADTPGSSDQPFNPLLPLPSLTTDGLYTYRLQATEVSTGTLSNKKDVLVILDTVPPVVSGVRVDVLGGLLVPSATVTVSWNASDANGLKEQTVAIMQTGATSYTQVTKLGGTQNTYTFTWGDRPAKGFVIQITATDPAGNIGSGVSPKWTPQVFNAALITSSVDCYFCHAKVYGDLGGINFSANSRSDTGDGFSVTGKIYGTNTVPALLANTAAGGSVSNYNNSPLVIFPKDGKFPQLSPELIKPRMNGSVRVGDLFFARNYEGNLILDGTKPDTPIVLNGEVFINGDLVIRGTYKGVGTIYAKNIYVANDLVAANSPFPFSEDPAAALNQAKAAIVNKTDALYLGALNQVLVGNYVTTMADACGPTGSGVACVNSNPFNWLSQADYIKLGTPSVLFKDTAGVAHPISGSFFQPGTADARAQMEVSRVDAFIYAQNNFAWRAYGNILLNGGFMAPYSGVLTSAPYRVSNDGTNAAINWAPNPRNGMPLNRNVIRYDYRLRVGGDGFETIKSFFDQN